MIPGEMLIDPLTGAYSRYILQNRLQDEVERGLRYQTPFSLLFMDLDHFKSINDAFGHAFGDLILVEFVNRLRKIVRAADILIRYGGDEFVILLPNTTKDQAVTMADRLVHIIQSQPFGADPPLNVKLSIGVATFPEGGQSAESLFNEADLRQFEAKRRGRGQVVADRLKSASLPFDEISRLVDRDNAMNITTRFLNRLPDASRGVLQINGRRGSGRTRFLGEVGKAARLRGYEVVSLRGSPALSARSYGVLLNAFSDWALPSPYGGVQVFAEALEAVLKDNGRMGILLTADDMMDFDWATLDLLHHLFVNRSIPLIGLAYSTSTDTSQRVFLAETPVSENIRLQPISLDGLRILLRSILYWDPPEEFVSWLHELSGGYPASVRRVLTSLHDQGLLKKPDRQWVIDPGYQHSTFELEQRAQTLAREQSLPAPPTNFVGREQEIQHVKLLMREKRLITLLGLGGVGKTRLALQAAYEIAEMYPQGVYFVPLSSVSSPMFLASAIAGALKFSFYSQEDPETQLINYLREKQLLLVLDNFEHIVEAAELIARILENAPQVQVLVTSRERLNIAGETSVELKGMGYPIGKLEEIEVFSSVQLFLLHARQVVSDFSLTLEERPHIARICQLVEGLPLGIELAASWVRMLTCEEIAREIEKNLDFLVTDLRGIPGRHRSLRGVFEHSWSLLSSEEKSVFSKLTVFLGGFRREAAAEIAGASLPTLTALANKSLLTRTPTGRYVIHEVLLKYAAEKLAEDSEEYRLAYDAHCRYYSSYLAQQENNLLGGRQKEALTDIDIELDNIRLAWNTAMEQEFSRIAPMIHPLGLFYLMRCYYREGRDVFTDAVEKCRRRCEAGMAVFGRLVLKEAHFRVKLGEHERPAELLRDALQALESAGDRSGMGEAYKLMGVIAEETSEYSKAIELCNKSIEICTESGNLFGLIDAMVELGVIHWLSGDYQQARGIVKQAMEHCRQSQNRWMLSGALSNLANIETDLNDEDAAYQLFNEALNITIEMGDKVGRAILLNNMGDLEMGRGNYKTALPLLEESLRLSEEAGDRSSMVAPLDNLADIAMYQKKYERARSLLQRCQGITREMGNIPEETFVISHLGLLDTAVGHMEEARQKFSQALALAIECSTRPIALEVIENVSEYLAAVNLRAEAVQYIGYVLQHPTSATWTRSRANNLLKSLADDDHMPDVPAATPNLPEIEQVLVELSSLLG